MNYELDQLIYRLIIQLIYRLYGTDVVRFIKSRRLDWLGHVRQMDDSRTTKGIIDWKPMGSRIRGR